MDELDRFRAFRSAVLDPPPEAERLAQDAVARAIAEPRRRRLGRALLVVLPLAAAGLAALLFAGPWRHAPSGVGRAEAALVVRNVRAALVPPRRGVLRTVTVGG